MFTEQLFAVVLTLEGTTLFHPIFIGIAAILVTVFYWTGHYLPTLLTLLFACILCNWCDERNDRIGSRDTELTKKEKSSNPFLTSLFEFMFTPIYFLHFDEILWSKGGLRIGVFEMLMLYLATKALVSRSYSDGNRTLVLIGKEIFVVTLAIIETIWGEGYVFVFALGTFCVAVSAGFLIDSWFFLPRRT